MSRIADEFYLRIRDEYGLDELSLDPAALLIDDLGFDSLDLVRLAVIVDAILPGYELPAEFDAIDIRLQDVVHYMEIQL